MTLKAIEIDWKQVLGLVRKMDPNAYGIVNSSKERELDGTTLTLHYTSDMIRRQMEMVEYTGVLKLVLRRLYKQDFQVCCVLMDKPPEPPAEISLSILKVLKHVIPPQQKSPDKPKNRFIKKQTPFKPIETVYKGYRFRSRLEARWAVFFDALGLEWEYEPEGFDLGEAGWYLPDFLVRVNGTSAMEQEYWEESWFVEVKPVGAIPAADQVKIDALGAQVCGFREGYIASGVLVVQGPPTMPVLWWNPVKSSQAADCTGELITRFDIDAHEHETVEKAVKAARSARFEHGESG